ncbi:type III secretion system protein SctP [Paraburkholderia flava]|uniref:type III secretion system protein SctP n=1 Tax=Paraburkholderia flava TaxID=2547393 RepID=UPI00105D270D|nr:type III secretion system protein SctP [Paraburkholderia flava]
MHTSGTHRSHLIPNAASSASDPLPSPADSAQLRRQAALFNAHRVALDEAEAEAEAVASDAFAQEPKADGDAEGSHAQQKAAQEAQQQPHAPMRWPTRGGSNGASLAAGDDDAGAGSGLVMLPLLVGEQESGQRHDPPPSASPQPRDDAKRDETPRARIPMPVPASLTMRIAPSTAAASTSGTQAATFATPQQTRPIAGVLARAGSSGSPLPATPAAQPDEQPADSQSNPSSDAQPFAMPHQQAAQPQPLAQAQTQSQAQPQTQTQTQPQRVEAASSTQTIAALDNKQPSAPLIDSIVSSVADFCANPVVFSCSPWHLTVPLDPALLPGCQLSLMLSHFDLTLRFSTSDTASQQLILRHADALKERLEILPGLHRDNRRGIDITVT